jgi:hypothetical protein
MMSTLRRMFRFGMRHGFALVLGFLVMTYPLSLWKPAEAMTSAAVAKWKKVALSDVALNLRLMALEELKQEGSSDALDALEAVAKKGALPVKVAACAQLGRVKSTASKGKLKGLLEDTTQATGMRMAAAAAIAEHWKDSGDLSYLQSKCAGNASLSAHCAVIASKVYGQ